MTGFSRDQKQEQFELQILIKELQLEGLRRQRTAIRQERYGAKRERELEAIDRHVARLEAAIETMQMHAENALLKQERKERNIAESNTRDRAIFLAFKALVYRELGEERTLALLDQATRSVEAKKVGAVPAGDGSDGEDE